MQLTLPASSLPVQDPSALWSLQSQLMSLAEDILGQRDVTKNIYQPVFAGNGPFIRNTPNLDGAFAELSRNAERYWPTAVYELAHETVHLLNPKPGGGTWLEEGIAVAFSVYAQTQYNLKPQSINMQSYRRALQLVSELPPDLLAAGRLIRETCGSLNKANPCTLETLFPDVDTAILTLLCESFDRDWTSSSTTTSRIGQVWEASC